MNTLSGYLDAAYKAWLGTAINCCSSPLKDESGRQALRREPERPMRIEHHEPHLVPPPIPEPQERPVTRGQEWAGRTRAYTARATTRGSFSVRRKLNAYNGPRRPRIGAPSDFRHVGSAAPGASRSTGFRPLELSIYTEQLSPLLPHFSTMEDLSRPEYPPSVLTHARSDSQLSFSIPRKPLRASSRASSQWTTQFQTQPDSLSTDDLLARVDYDMPKSPPPARLRAMTEPPTYERIKSALHEKYELEQKLKDIDEVIEERRSVYFNSRPTSRATSRHFSIYSESREPMPSPPPLKPSFAARVASPSDSSTITTIIKRPQTAPSTPSRLQTISTSSPNIPSPPLKSPLRAQGYPLPPPLPLVLVQPKAREHPPLRKKKSFFRVSNWLFPSSMDKHSRVSSLDSVTNTPKPVTLNEGFYQCVEAPQDRRDSESSASTVSTTPTISTTLSENPENEGSSLTVTPQSSPGRGKGKEMKVFEKESTVETTGRAEEKSLELERMRTFGEEQRWRSEMVGGARISSVGVAF